MNERIKELAKEYLVHERFTTYGESIQEDYYEMYPDELEKFAQSIAQECIKIIENEAIQYGEPIWAIELVNDVKDRFGVEDEEAP